jgi:hypothetical protein
MWGAVAAAGVSALSSRMNQNEKSQPSSGDDFSINSNDGIQSTMNGNQQNTSIAPSSTEGSQSGALQSNMMTDAFKTGMSSVLGHATSSRFSKSASQQGRDQKDYLSAAFPEMNPWERAGASATQQGVQMAETKQKQSMLTQQIEGQKDVARIQGDNAARVAEINKGTSKYGADSSYNASIYGSDKAADSSRHATDSQSVNVDKQIAALRKKVQADTKLALEKAKTESEAKSIVGGIAKSMGVTFLIIMW